MSARPTYESAEDRHNEAKIASKFARAGWEAFKLPPSYRADFAFVSSKTGVIMAYAECKRRKNAFGYYPTLLIAVAKWDALVVLGARVKFGSFIVIQFDDGIYYVQVDDMIVGPPLKGGRTDRGDSADIEPTIHVSIEYFRKLNG